MSSNSPDHSVLVTIHDQNLLLDFVEREKFNSLDSPLHFVFVGNGSIDKLEGRQDVTIARNLPNNIEDNNYLVDFTSWFAAVKNNLISSEFVSLIQYDVAVSNKFCDASIQAMNKNPEGILSYSYLPMRDRNFIRDNMGFKPLEKALWNVYGIDLKDTLRKFHKSDLDPFWPTTNNVCMSVNTLRDFVRWFSPLGLAMENVKPSGHAFERAVKTYAVLCGRRIDYADGLLEHFQMNSHSTQDFERTATEFIDLSIKTIE